MTVLEQVEKNIRELSGNLLLQSELVARFERATEQRLASVESQTESQAAQLKEFRAVVARVLDLLERFISGQGGAYGQAV